MAARKRRENELSDPGTVGRRIQDVRMRLGWTQADVANRAGTFRASELSRVESNELSGGSEKWRGGFARAFGIDRETLANYLDGELSIEAFLQKRRSSAAPPPKSGQRPATMPPSSVFRAASALAIADGADERAVESVRAELPQLGRASGGQLYLAILAESLRQAVVARDMRDAHEKTQRAMDSIAPSTPVGERDSVRLRRL